MDVDDASFRQVVADLTEKYGKKIAPHFQPIRENEKLVGYINIIKNAGRRYTGLGQREECEIPDYCKPNLEILRDSLMEACLLYTSGTGRSAARDGQRGD